MIYLFYPHGSRKISDIRHISHVYDFIKKPHADWIGRKLQTTMLFHDQEPLNFDLYNDMDPKIVSEWLGENVESYSLLIDGKIQEIPGSFDIYAKWLKDTNLKFIMHGRTLHDRMLLVHSEQRSQNLEKYEKLGCQGIYWWSHAAITRDWFRYAKIDPRLTYGEDFDLDFNIYNRAWSGSREYRLKFLSLVSAANLKEYCNVKFNRRCDGVDYRNHVYKNPRLDVGDFDFSDIEENTSPPSASADYDNKDYTRCALDIVLETVCDDDRWHLTEKTLRPIACGKPFILVGTQGSLQYLRSYGFQTFSRLIDESYDNESDIIFRLEKIVSVMRDIARAGVKEKRSLYRAMHAVAQENQRWYWSDDFARKIFDEFQQNYRQARECIMNIPCGQNWIQARQYMAGLDRDYVRALIHSQYNPPRPVWQLQSLLKLARSGLPISQWCRPSLVQDR